MKKIFLVDDEIVVREGIRNCIDWESEGLVYCGDAPDGEIALPLIEKLNPDIVITDIKMPFMDGLELSRILKEKMPSIKIIILSGHDEFEFAREAMRIQINEYCLKPISSNDLLNILTKVISQIDLEKQDEKLLENLKDQASQNVSRSQIDFLKELCEGSYSTSDAINEAANHRIDIISNYYLVLILKLEDIPGDLEEWLTDDISTISFKSNLKETVYIMRSNSRNHLESQALLIKHRLIHLSNTDPDNPVVFGLGKVRSRVQGIALSFSEANEDKIFYCIVNKYHLLKSGEDVLSKKDIQHVNRKELIHFLKFGDLKNIAQFCEYYSAHLDKPRSQTSFYYYYFLIDFTITVSEYMKEHVQPPKSIIEEITVQENRISRVSELSEVLEYMNEILCIVIQNREDSNSRFYPIIQKAKEYIEEHFNEAHLSLQMIASEVNVSSSYFSHMFSQETNQTLSEYLTRVRLDKAKELLKTTNDKTYEIAHKVGYSDAHYFCKLFKKDTGMTTKEFKTKDMSLESYV
ncbi:DNA-binding response regulator [Salipaludibacillus neizhouensis]|uniref:DNA-binding response regulator n=1 Tax=Salipaludibacillus neizhouensis TaxID=885475 RepID=A0A3A9K7K7_9BACI|nr:response regulator [Salipaludibacillus neizhouensis]RKL65643.1 DNA-binding response regulator [Salipaludibacillus neizhouensis]